MYLREGAHGIPWGEPWDPIGGSMGSQGGPLGTHGPLGTRALGDPLALGPWGPGPLGTHWPLGTQAQLVDPLAMGTRAGSGSTGSVYISAGSSSTGSVFIENSSKKIFWDVCLKNPYKIIFWDVKTNSIKSHFGMYFQKTLVQ